MGQALLWILCDRQICPCKVVRVCYVYPYKIYMSLGNKTGVFFRNFYQTSPPSVISSQRPAEQWSVLFIIRKCVFLIKMWRYPCSGLEGTCGSEGMPQIIFITFCIKWRWVVKFKLRPLYPRQKWSCTIDYESVWFSVPVWMLREGDNVQRSTCLTSTQPHSYWC